MSSSNAPLYRGAYVAAVRTYALGIIERGGEFTVSSFCRETGLKDTRNLRRRLAELVYAGTLGYTMGYSEQGHLTGFFHKPYNHSPSEQLAFPF